LHIGTCKVFIFTSIFKHYYNFSTNFSKTAKFNENLPKLRLTSKLSIRVLSVKKRLYSDGRDRKKAQDEAFICGKHMLDPVTVILKLIIVPIDKTRRLTLTNM